MIFPSVVSICVTICHSSIRPRVFFFFSALFRKELIFFFSTVLRFFPDFSFFFSFFPYFFFPSAATGLFLFVFL